MQHLNNASALAAMLYYAERGWPVYPASPKTRQPLHIADPYEAEQREFCGSTDPDQIREWLQRWPQAAPAIKTGRGSGLVAVSPRSSGVDPVEALAEGGLTLPDTLTIRSGPGELDYLYALPPGLSHWERPETKAVRLAPRCLGYTYGDCFGIVAPPGPSAEHPVVWDNSLPLAPVPDWLLRKMPLGAPGSSAHSIWDTFISPDAGSEAATKKRRKRSKAKEIASQHMRHCIKHRVRPQDCPVCKPAVEELNRM